MDEAWMEQYMTYEDELELERKYGERIGEARGEARGEAKALASLVRDGVIAMELATERLGGDGAEARIREAMAAL